MVVRQLNPGQEFRINLGPYGNLEYRLLYANECRAYVEPLKKVRRTVVTSDLMETAEFETSAGRINIAPTTECEMIDSELEEMMGKRKAQAPPAGKTKTEKAPRQPSGPLGSKPLNPDTKRGKIIAMLKDGKTIDAAAKAVDVNRGCLMSHLSDARKFNGIEHSKLDGDKVKITMGAAVIGKKAAKAPAAKAPAAKTKVADDDASDLL